MFFLFILIIFNSFPKKDKECFANIKDCFTLDIENDKKEVINKSKSPLSNEMHKETKNAIFINVNLMTKSGNYKCINYTKDEIFNFDLNFNEINQNAYACITSEGNFSYFFKGVKFGLYGIKSKNHGKFLIEVDGVQIYEIDGRTNKNNEYGIIFISPELEYKEHHISTIGLGQNYEISELFYFPKSEIKNETITMSTLEISQYENNKLYPIPENRATFDEIKMPALILGDSNEDDPTDEFKGQINVRNCIFRKSSSLSEGGNALYISTKGAQDDSVNDTVIEVVIENNFYNKCGESGYVNTIESEVALMRNNTFNFTGIECTCGAFHIIRSGNFTITDCHFIQMKASGVILYAPDTAGKEENYLTIEECSFSECEGTCCIIRVIENSNEMITINECEFDKCKAGSDQSIALYINRASISILNNSFTECLNDDENVYIINYQGNRNKQRYVTFEGNLFYNSNGAIKIEQNDGDTIICNCSFKETKNNPIFADFLSSILINDCFFDKCVGGFEVRNNINKAIIENCIFSDCYSSNDAAVLIVSNHESIIHNNIINFTSIGVSKVGSVHVNSIGSHTITNCYSIFGRGDFGIFRYDPKILTDSIEISFTFINNTVESCDGDINGNNDNIALNFKFKDSEQISIENNTIKNTEFSGSIVGIELSNKMTEFTLDRFKFIGNSVKRSNGGGCGLNICNNETEISLILIDCLFENNKAISDGINDSYFGCGGGWMLGQDERKQKIKVTMIECIFRSNSAEQNGGGFAIHTIFPFSIENCSFYYNKAENGGAIFIETTVIENNSTFYYAESGSITNCSFSNNIATSENGNILFISNSLNTTIDISGIDTITNNGELGSTIYSQCGNLIVTDILFNFKSTNNLLKNFRVAHINDGKSSFINCRFIETGFSNNPTDGHAILIDTNTQNVIFNDCVFTDCGDQLSKYVIYSKSFGVQFISSVINCSKPFASCGGICINKWSNLTVLNSTFRNIYANNTALGGGISYTGTGKKIYCSVSISGCTFDNLMSRNGRAMYLILSQIGTINNCTIKNMPFGGYTMTIGQESKEQMPIVLEQISFIDNEVSTPAPEGGGGIGVWVSQVNECTFQECRFIRNKNKQDNNGGVFGSSHRASNSRVGRIFNKCYFEDNKVKESYNGGSFFIYTAYKPVIIDSCTFVNTITDTSFKGGAICVGNESKYDITITNSNFTQIQVTSTEKTSGNAIYIENGKINLSIIGCKFTNCGETGSVIAFLYEDEMNEPNQNDIKKTINIECCTFENSKPSEAIYIYFNGFFDDLWIQKCTFDGYSKTNNPCFNLSLDLNSFDFIDNIIKNFNNVNSMNYNGIIKFNHQIEQFLISNVTFQNNACNSLYGGGVGILIEGASKLTFEECQFINNRASQDRTVSRPPFDSYKPYYNGDGGGIQIGYLASNINIDILFERCIFRENKAHRHGGAIAIQTLSAISIVECTFERNSANNKLDSSLDLLVDDHFYSHQEGKGGSIYINPSFDTEYLGDTINQSSANSCILITKCKFESNEGFDGSSIYFAGESKENILNITDNEFYEDTNKENISIILTEICKISKTQLLKDNNFTNSNGNEINILTTDCKYTSSQKFSKSSFFSSSDAFTASSEFSLSDSFTNSNEFTTSSSFTPSKMIPSATPINHAYKKITVSKSFSLTYVNRKSVSFSLSFFASNTYEMSYDENIGTYTIVITQRNYQTYFPYIIYYLSPLYVERSIMIDLTPKNRITPEQLIGVVCGSVSVFFLILGIIILSVRKRTETQNLYDDYENCSYSSSEAEIFQKFNETNEPNPYENHETIDFNTKDYAESYF